MLSRPLRIIVSGATGHVGRSLIDRLVAADVEVHGLTRDTSSGPQLLMKGVTLHRIDRDRRRLEHVFQALRPQIVVHLAAVARRTHEASDVASFVESNILFGTQLLETMRLCGCKCFVTAESVLQFSEVGEYHPVNLYAATKQAFSDLLFYYTGACDLSAIALVLPTIYSEYETVPKLMTDVARSLRNGTPLSLGSEEVPLDFVHVEDVADAFILACSILGMEPLGKAGSLKRYWISSGTDITPTELVKLFERIGKSNIPVQRSGAVNLTRRRRPYHGSILPGWALKIDIETGIRRMLSIQ